MISRGRLRGYKNDVRYRSLVENDTLAPSIYDPMKYCPDKYMVSFIRRHKAHFPAPVKANEEDDRV